MIATLFQKISNDSLEARKNHELEKLSVLQLAISDIKNEKINKRKELSDEETEAVIAKQVKQMKDALTDFEKANREDLISKTKREIEILETYLPEKLAEEEVEKIVKEIIEKSKPISPNDFGKIMGQIMKELKGRADGNLVQSLVKKNLV
jgi:uncharacterized protein YqeY